jgi:methionyl aminopeptidase
LIVRRSKKELDKMAAAGKIVAETLDEVGKSLVAGITTGELDSIAERHIRSRDAVPAFLGYSGFPASICASINNEVVHGIPNRERRVQDGDIVSVDVGAIVAGYYGDAAMTFGVGQISPEAAKLMEVTRGALMAGIEHCRPGSRLSDIGAAIQRHAESFGFSVVRRYVGHGIGRRMHEDPPVPNYGEPGRGPVLKPGMVLAIEPMVNIGGADVVTLGDEWTVVTTDGSLSAHFEHTVAVGKNGPVILTALNEEAKLV